MQSYSNKNNWHLMVSNKSQCSGHHNYKINNHKAKLIKEDRYYKRKRTNCRRNNNSWCWAILRIVGEMQSKMNQGLMKKEDQLWEDQTALLAETRDHFKSHTKVMLLEEIMQMEIEVMIIWILIVKAKVKVVIITLMVIKMSTMMMRQTVEQIKSTNNTSKSLNKLIKQVILLPRNKKDRIMRNDNNNKSLAIRIVLLHPQTKQQNKWKLNSLYWSFLIIKLIEQISQLNNKKILNKNSLMRKFKIKISKSPPSNRITVNNKIIKTAINHTKIRISRYNNLSLNKS